jgi:glycosyltransferase involved in cell wall biosynthesis
VVAADVGGLSDAIVQGRTGVLVPPREPAALRAALEWLLADGAERARLGGAAREHARRTFSHVAATRALTSVYDAAARAAA